MAPSTDIQQLLIEKIRQADRPGARALLADWGSERGYDCLLAEVLEPTLLQIGEQWCSNDSFTLAQAYVAGKVAEDALLLIDSQVQPDAQMQATKGPVILGNIEEDFHALGRRMVGMFLRTHGWQVHDLGNDVSATVFVDQALGVNAHIIGVSAMTLTTAHNIRQLRAEIDRRHLTDQLKLAVGGAVFLVCPELVEEVGADATAANALSAVELFDRLRQQCMPKEVNA